MTKNEIEKKAKARMRMAVVMQTAWMFVREEGMPLGEAMRVAYLNYRLRGMLFHGHVRFVYKKSNGETREAVGTLCGGIFDNNITGTGHATPKRNQLYWDDEANDFRSFRKARLMAIVGRAA